ncbi:MAG: hypothetical protein KJ634_10475 [Gammaproteobacteria bacterium]|nr:hypothetical protein [Gammaproteobacteria bacterium]MBU1416037.1 hypothetical protein [Gammaproteobacteria bacterium]
MAGLAISSIGAASTQATRPAGRETGQLSPEQQREVARLREIDRKVRAHEAAHMAAGGGLVTGGATYTYAYGPDGKAYAVAGEVGIDTSGEAEPEANISKGQRIQAAALAPADPSPQDYRVASVGAQLTAQGRAELAAERRHASELAKAYQSNDESVGSTVDVSA